ncbi:tetratricopeptide repeat protein [Elusimicrobiota bacterium]
MHNIKILVIRLFLVPLCLCAFAPSLYCQKAGGGAGDIWSFGAGARSLGLANATMALADDATAGYWNPARLSYLGRANMNVLHASLYEGAAYDYMGVAYPTLAKGTVGLNIVRLGIGGVEQRDENNNLMGSFSFSNTGVSISYGNRFGSKLAIGGSAKYLTRTLPGAVSSLMSIDAGLDYRAFRFGEVGLVLRDMFYTASGTDDELPMNAVLGASYGLFEGALKLSGEVEQQGMVFKGGMEYGIGPASVRVGMGSMMTTGGFGFKYQNMQIDYAIQVHELGNSSRFSLGVWFGTSKASHKKRLAGYYREKAADAYRDGRFIRAYRLLDKALVFDPADALALGRKERVAGIARFLGLSRREMKKPGKNASKIKKQQYVYTVRGLTNYVEADTDGAILLLRQALAIDPSNEGLRNIYNKVVAESGKTGEKDKPLLSPKANIGAQLSEADRHFRQGRFDLAVKSCEDAVKLDPANALAHERLGSSYFALGLKEKAIEQWQKALDINPDNRPLKQFLNRFKGQQ